MQTDLAYQLLLVRPAAFGFNTQTAASNAFQQNQPSLNPQALALAEFDAAVVQIQAAGIGLHLLHDQPLPAKPDAIFPNNWFSTHLDGQLILYPLLAENRRLEATTEHVTWLQGRSEHRETLDLRHHAENNTFLEGTGSLVFDHAHRLVLATGSARSSPTLVQQVAKQLGYKGLVLEAADAHGNEIYHTNVVMSISPRLAICCFKALRDPDQAALLAALLQRNGRRVIAVSLAQMQAFCCNALVVQASDGQPRILLSETAWNAFEAHQQLWIAEVAEPIVLRIPTIETLGGGSVRCLLAELW